MPPPFLRRAWFAATDWVWPRVCLLCEARMTEPADVCLCPACVTALTTDPHQTCLRCSSTIGPHTDTSAGCSRCRDEVVRFDSATRLGVYDGRLREAVLRIKHVAGDALAEALGTVFAHKLRQRSGSDGPQLVVPVPLHWRRRLTRGYNQAESVARGIATELRVPLATRAVRRVRPTPKQTAVTPAERRRNVAGAFRPTTLAAVKGLRVLLVDDVLTTGATADAVATAVRTAGAAQVHVAVLAHR